MRPSVSVRAVVLLAALTAAAACGGKREPIFIDPELAKTPPEIETIAFMPVIDVRPEPFTYVEIGSQARRVGARLLTRKGYRVIAETLSGPERTFTDSELAAMSDAELAALGSADLENLLFVYVEKLEHGFDERGEGSRVTLSGVLISKASGEVIWRDRAVGDSNMTGLFTVLTGPSTEYEAVWTALRILFSTIPDRERT